MKARVFCLHFFIQLSFALVGKAQLNDKNWVIGYAGSFGLPYGINHLVFDLDTLQINYHSWNQSFSTANCSMSDSAGNFIFASNGAVVFNQLGDTMDNGVGLSPCMYTDDFGPDGLKINQGVLALPFPGHPNKYVLFHEKIPYSTYADQAFEWDYSIINMESTNGLGRVNLKNIILVSDTNMVIGNVTATRHANGRDWWIIKPRRNSNSVFISKLTANGVQNAEIRNLNVPFSNFKASGASWSCFSPNGEYYAQWILSVPQYFLQISIFDRCTGDFTNTERFDFTDQFSGLGLATISFSPNGRFLYLANIDKVFQFDLEAQDILASIDTVAIFDGSSDPDCIPCKQNFYILQPAPNGKIYCSSTNGVRTMHVINHPNVKGDCCDFKQHAVQLQAFYAYGLPNFPYYRLGPVDGSSCDTLGLDNIYAPDTTDASYVCDSSLLVSNGMKYPPIVSIYPNPASDWVQLASNASKGLEYSACLFSLTGEKVLELSLGKMNTALDVSNLPNGIYMVEISNRINQTKVVRKLSVVH